MEAVPQNSPLDIYRDILREGSTRANCTAFANAFWDVANFAFNNKGGLGREALDILLKENVAVLRKWRETSYEAALLKIALKNPEYRLEILPCLTHAGRTKNLIAAYVAGNPGDAFNSQQIALLCVTALAGTKGVAIGDVARTHQLIARQYSLNDQTSDKSDESASALKDALHNLTQMQFDPPANDQILVQVFGEAVTILKDTVPNVIGSVETFIGAEASQTLLKLRY